MTMLGCDVRCCPLSGRHVDSIYQLYMCSSLAGTYCLTLESIYYAARRGKGSRRIGKP